MCARSAEIGRTELGKLEENLYARSATNGRNELGKLEYKSFFNLLSLYHQSYYRL